MAASTYRLGYNLEDRAGPRMLDTLRQRGRTAGASSAVRLAVQYSATRALYRAVHRDRRISVGGKPLSYLPQPNHTERVVEVPWALGFATQAPAGGRALEVGNVLNRYQPFPHVVLDRYEVAPGVLNVDVTEFEPPERFPLILSVSTLEHVGFDEPERTAGKFRTALRHLREVCLAPGGQIAVTVPLGYNPEVDDWVRAKADGLGRCYLLHRYSSLNLWREVEPSALESAPDQLRFDRAFPGASYVALWSFVAAGD
ncbi:MAG: hypothetical protein L3K04_05675 [Thermoplasmata archaeon]|nr:hypothetical protein [Thermoplasmata archaeon]